MFIIPGMAYFPPPPPPPIEAGALQNAMYTQRWFPRSITVDQVWLLRDQEQDWRNEDRRKDWETRFKVLGPRPQDVAGKNGTSDVKKKA